MAVVGNARLVKVAWPVASTAMLAAPTKAWPSPLPDESQELLRNASSRKFGLLSAWFVSSVPLSVSWPPESVALARTG